MNAATSARRRPKYRSVTRLALLFAVVLGCGAPGVRARQEQEAPEPKTALIVGSTAYTPLPARFVCTAGRNLIRVSPDGKTVLIQHTVDKPISTLESLAVATDDDEEILRHGELLRQQLLLLRQDNPQVQIVWQGGGSLSAGLTRFQNVRWITGTQNALVTVSAVRGPLTPEFLNYESDSKEMEAARATETTAVMLVNAETGKTKSITSGFSRYTWLLVSRTHPVAVAVDLEDNSFVRIDANGKVGPHVHLSKPDGRKEAPLPSGFLADGQTLTAHIFETEPDGKQMRTYYYQVDSLTGQITTVDATANKPALRPADPPPFTVQRETVILTRDGTATKVHPLWLEGRDKTTTGRILIAADSDTDRAPVLLESGVLYYHKGTLFLVPLLKIDAAEFRARQRRVSESAHP